MPIFDVEAYNSRRTWDEKEFLVNGDETVKKCRVCCGTYYTVEFVNNLSFPDGKLPVCTFCLKRKKNREKAWEHLGKYQVRQECSKCKESKDLAQFSLGGNGDTLTKICRVCSS